MNTVILGAGIVGITTAYELAQRGHGVTVVDAESAPAMRTSFANGGQVSVSEAMPWASPASLRMAILWMTRPGAPFRFGLRPDPDQWAWITAFVRNCTNTRWHRNAHAMLNLGALSLARLTEIRQQADIRYDREARGILRVFGDRHAAAAEARHLESLVRRHGIRLETLDADACAALEPALEQAVERGRVGGGIFAPDDESGDAHVFAQELAAACRRMGVHFIYDDHAEEIESLSDRVTGLVTARHRIRADRLIVAGGVGSRDLLRHVGLSLPIWPVRGYSATIDVTGSNSAPRVSITDQANRIVVSRFGNRLRVAGKADIAGRGDGPDPQRADDVMRNLFDLFPDAGDRCSAETWSGERPMTPNGIPLIGETDMRGLFVNTGHGSLGWTLSAGSAVLLADLIDGRTPRLDPAPYSPRRWV